MKSFRERYFEDYTTVLRPDGKTVEYRYIGPWYAWSLKGRELTRQKVLYIAIELVGVVLFLASALMRVESNNMGIVVIPSVLGIVLWLIELYAVLKLCLGKPYYTELDYLLTHHEIIYAGFFRSLLFVFAGIASMSLGISGRSERLSILSGLLLILSGACAMTVAVLQRHVYYRTFKNVGGEVGEEV